MPVLIGCSDSQLTAVTEVFPEGRTAWLEPEPFVTTWHATRSRDHEAPPRTIADLRRALDAADDLGVRFPDGTNAGVIGWEHHNAQIGHAHDWAVAVLSTAPWQAPDVT